VPTQPTGEPEPEGPRFCPLDPITRNQMAVFLQRAFGLTPAQPRGLTDLDQSATNHVPAIGAILQAGVTQGCFGGDRYCGGDQVKRGQMASFLMRALDVVGRSPACPASAPHEPQVLDLATTGFPVNSGTADPANDRLYLFTNGLNPQRLIVVELSTRQVLADHRVTGSGTRVWASTIAGDHLYLGRWGTGSGHNFVRVPLAQLEGGSPQFRTIGMEGLGGATPLDNRLRNADGATTDFREFWALTGDDRGRVYAGTGRQDTVYRFTPPEVTGDASGLVEAARLVDLPEPPTEAGRQVTALAWTPSGLVVGTGRGSGVAHVVAPAALDPDPAPSGDPLAREWSSQALRVPGTGSATQELRTPEGGTNGIYASLAVAPTTESPGRVVLTTEEERSRLAEFTLPPLPADDAPSQPFPLVGVARGTSSPERTLTEPAIGPSGDAVTTGASSTALYEATSPTSLTSHGAPVPASVTRMMVTVAPGTPANQLLGVTANGTIWRRDTADASQTQTTSLESAERRGPEPPQWLAAGRAGTNDLAIVGGNNKVSVHILPAPGATTAPRPVQDVLVPGEAKTALAVGRDVFAATYPGGELRRFTVSTNGTVGAATLVASWSDDYNRPRDMAYDAANDRLVIGVKGDSGFGAVVSVGRDGSGLREWDTRWVLPGGPDLLSQEPLTVAVTGDGTAILGTPNGYVVGFDHLRGRKLWEVRPTNASIRGLTVTADGVVHGIATNGTRFRIVDPQRGTLTTSPYLGPGGSTSTSLLTDGAAGQVGQLTVVGDLLVAGSANRLVAIDPATGAERLLSEGRAPSSFTSRAHAVAVPGEGCRDVLTFRALPDGAADARVARASVARPRP
jgi:outer membrane protein assembly factor BamB